MKEVWILTYTVRKYIQDDPAREIFGVYDSEESAKLGLENEFFAEGYSEDDEPEIERWDVCNLAK